MENNYRNNNNNQQNNSGYPNARAPFNGNTNSKNKKKNQRNNTNNIINSENNFNNNNRSLNNNSINRIQPQPQQTAPLPNFYNNQEAHSLPQNFINNYISNVPIPQVFNYGSGKLPTPPPLRGLKNLKQQFFRNEQLI